MTNAQRILTRLDARLTSQVELTLYGRAALHEKTNFREAIEYEEQFDEELEEEEKLETGGRR